MFIIRKQHQRLLRRLAGLIIFVLFALGLLWRYFEDITQPWVPNRPGDSARIEKAIIIPAVRLSELKYLKKETDLLEAHEFFIYCMGRSRRPECHYPKTKHGREAAAYLTYIVDFYDALPKYSIFIHSIDEQWHNDIIGAWTQPSLRTFRYEAADALGFANLRCTHAPTCPVSVRPLDPSPIDRRKNNIRARFAETYQHFFNTTREEVPEAIGAACCAQFVLTREHIRKRPKADYARMLKWLADNTLDDARDQGWIFETTWHIIFGKEAQYCPRVEQCRCDLYGWCGPLRETGEILKPVGGR